MFERMLERGISRRVVLDAIDQGAIIENYDNYRPYPSVLIFNGQPANPLHVVVALNIEESTLHIITVYRPDLKHFSSDYKTRLKP